MSDTTDDMEHDTALYEAFIDSDVWTCRDGRTVCVCDMDNQHLLNTMRLLERFAENEYKNAIDMASLCFNGDAAVAHSDDVLENCVYEDFLPDIYYKMKKELLKREIKIVKLKKGGGENENHA